MVVAIPMVSALYYVSDYINVARKELVLSSKTLFIGTTRDPFKQLTH